MTCAALDILHLLTASSPTLAERSSQGGSQSMSLLRLPYDILSRIAEELDLSDVVRFALTNSMCNLVVKDLVASPSIFVWNSRYQGGFNSLMNLVILGRKDLIIKLLNRGVDINVRDPMWGESALHVASTNGLINMVKLLLERGCNWKNRCYSGDMAVHFAAQGGHADIVDLFLRFDPSLAIESNYSSANLLHQAAQNGHVNVANLLCQRGVIPQLDNFLRTPLVVAASFGHSHVVSLLLNLPIFKHLIDHPGNDGFTPLHWAAFSGREDIAEMLIQKGACLTAGGTFETPLHTAAKRGSCEVLEVLLRGRFKHEINTPRNDQHTPLHLAAKEGHISACDLLLKCRADPNVPRPDGYTTLQYAAVCKFREIFDLLVANGANINARHTQYNFTTLHILAGQGDTREGHVRLLLDRGAIFSHLVQDNNGNTVLHYAAGSGSEEVVAFLLTRSNRDKLLTVNHAGLTALGLARMVGQTRAGVINLLEQAEIRLHTLFLSSQTFRI